MKKTILLAVALLFAYSAHAQCQIGTNIDDETLTVLLKHGGLKFKNSEQMCLKLQRANARIQINASATVLGNKSIGWALLTLKDSDTGIATFNFARRVTQINPTASQDVADALMAGAVNQAAEDWVDFDKAVAALEVERKRVKAVYGASR